jgi:hypothetical protein
MIILEGWTDMVESAGFYRSEAWAYPTQYINLIRRYSDSSPMTLRFEAEGADFFFDTTEENLGGGYSDRSLDVEMIPNEQGWYVGWVEPGEWLEYVDVQVGRGTYLFSARVATSRRDTSMHLLLRGIPATALPFTNDTFQFVKLGETYLSAGRHNFRILFETSDIKLDWFFMKQTTAGRPRQLHTNVTSKNLAGIIKGCI